jgi:hypothetical protein
MGFAQSIKSSIAWILSDPPAVPPAAAPPAAPAKAETDRRPGAVKLANDDLSGASAVKKPRGRPRKAKQAPPSAAPAVAVPLPNGNGVLLLPYKPSSPPLPDAESA